MAAVISKELRDEVLAEARQKQDRVKADATALYMERIARMSRTRGLTEGQASRLRERALRRVDELLSL